MAEMTFKPVIFSLILCSLTTSARAGAPAYPDLTAGKSTRPIALVGDLQHTLLWEKLIGRESNDRGRVQLVETLHREAPGLVVLLGDMVSWGGNSAKWREFDSLMRPFLNEKVPMLPAVGNHDYMGGADKARLNFQDRFAQLRLAHWYSRTYNGLGLIWLDSNHDQLSAEDWQKQKTWLQATLKTLDEDSSVRAVFVFQHHPPFTNSAVTGDDKFVQADFLPAFQAAHKTLAMITGHTHSYEHFKTGGKDFIVSGGGGGPRVKLLTGTKRRHEDLYSGAVPRPLHYLLMESQTDGILISVKGSETPPLIDSFTLKWPTAN